MESPDLSIIIVNYNGKDDLLLCLKSLHAVRNELRLEVIVVDNGSQDGSPEAVSLQFSWVNIIKNNYNVGFAAACNRGLAAARGRHAMLLNPDTEVFPNALNQLITALDTNPHWGIAGPQMIDQDNRPYLSARRFPTPWYLFCECTRLAYMFPRSKFFANYFYGNCNRNSLNMVDQIEGSALIISGPARIAVGAMDERFFLFFEEVDLCKRVWDAGFEIHVVKDAVIRHNRATTMSRFYVDSRRANAESALRFFDKYYGNKGIKKLRRWMLAALSIRQIMTAILLLSPKRDLARLRWQGARAEKKIYCRGLSK
jgi:GT2 family glycosyltransferase